MNDSSLKPRVFIGGPLAGQERVVGGGSRRYTVPVHCTPPLHWTAPDESVPIKVEYYRSELFFEGEHQIEMMVHDDIPDDGVMQYLLKRYAESCND